MGFFDNLTTSDFLEEPTEVKPVVLNTAAEIEEKKESENLSMENEKGDTVLNEMEDVLSAVGEMDIVSTEKEKKEPDSSEKGKKKSVKKAPVLKETDMECSTIISEGTKIEGSVDSITSIYVEGYISGDITSKETITITSSGVIKGSVSGEMVHIDGEVFGIISADCVILRGKLRNNLMVKNAVTLEATSIITGDITATNAVIEGKIKGDLDINGPVFVSKTAVIKGNIKAAQINIEPGAKISGSVILCYGDTAEIADDVFE